jgi:uncharacterized membrane protein YjjP (DUF1212 family)
MFTVIEQLAIDFMLQLLQVVIKNPAEATKVQNQLISIATDIANAYGYVLTSPTGAVVSTKK